jgi:hypothetical protein
MIASLNFAMNDFDDDDDVVIVAAEFCRLTGLLFVFFLFDEVVET